MPILLYRVDDRLIHGQVVVGWGNRLDPSRYIVVDDDLADSGWEQQLYELGLPDGVEAEFVTVDRARESLDRWRCSEVRSVLLTRNVATALALARDGRLRGERINLGGIHHGPGRTRALPYVYLDEDDRRRLRTLDEEEDVEVTAQDLPGSDPVELDRLLS